MGTGMKAATEEEPLPDRWRGGEEKGGVGKRDVQGVQETGWLRAVDERSERHGVEGQGQLRGKEPQD